MSRSASITHFSPKEDSWLPCRECGRATWHYCLCGITRHDQSPDGIIQEWEDYAVIRCRGCGTPSLYLNSKSTEETYWDEEANEEELIERVQIFPSRVVGRRVLEGIHTLPFGVRTIYLEAHAAFANGLPVLAGAGLRAVVEAICSDKSAAGKNLEEKIDSLKTLSLVTKDGAEILHGLRFMGNDALHDIKAHSEAELHVAFDVVEHIILGVYVLPGHTNGVLRRRA